MNASSIIKALNAINTYNPDLCIDLLGINARGDLNMTTIDGDVYQYRFGDEVLVLREDLSWRDEGYTWREVWRG